MAEKCRNTSSPFSVVMKPNPLASLNHLTVPVCFTGVSPFCVSERSYPSHITSITARTHRSLGGLPGGSPLATIAAPMSDDADLATQMQDLGVDVVPREAIDVGGAPASLLSDWDYHLFN